MIFLKLERNAGSLPLRERGVIDVSYFYDGFDS
jgi:hypothetical protein